jgi:prepilin-type N-terminal cleavage/methylation domain-containing protein
MPQRLYRDGLRKPASRHGFTLFEVTVSLLILSVAITASMLIFPAGLKAQQLARFHLYASMKAEEMVESFATLSNDNTNIDTEAFYPWDVPSSYHVVTPDLEARISSPHHGVMPVPLTIARRLDSTGDEIQHLLNNGGYLYYAQAQANGQLQEQYVLDTLDAPPSETQKLVFAVVGEAQQNAMFTFPWKSWPYYTPYPSPPMHGAFLTKTATTIATPQFQPSNPYEFMYPWYDSNACYEGSVPVIGAGEGIDGDIRVVFTYTDPALGNFGFKPYAYDTYPGATTLTGAIRYLQAAVWFCKKKGLGIDHFDPATTTPLTVFTLPPLAHWQEVNAMRFLAHAATCFTKFKTLAELGGQPSNSASGFIIPAVTLKGINVPQIRLTHDKIVFYHESCMNLVMKYAAANPYDWGAPRPMQRAIMMDYPLLQYDLFSPPLTGTLFDKNEGLGTVTAAQWRAIPGSPIRNIGVSTTFPDRAIGPANYQAPNNGETIWGDTAHFTLTAPFEASERCRELVFWSVDWQSYVDAETAPSAPVDASKLNIASAVKSLNFVQRMEWINWEDMHLRDSRNPERHSLFIKSVDALATGSSLVGYMMDNGSTADEFNRSIFCGLYGADRNYNRVLDRGPIPTSVRLRAVEVARFNFYDPRVPAVMK